MHNARIASWKRSDTTGRPLASTCTLTSRVRVRVGEGESEALTLVPLASMECVDTLEYADALQEYFDKTSPYGTPSIDQRGVLAQRER